FPLSFDTRFFFSCSCDHRSLHSFPTRRSSDLENKQYIVTWALGHLVTNATPEEYDTKFKEWKLSELPIIPDYMKHVVIKKTRSQDRKSTRLNSSHVKISYAVFCLKKKIQQSNL